MNITKEHNKRISIFKFRKPYCQNNDTFTCTIVSQGYLDTATPLTLLTVKLSDWDIFDVHFNMNNSTL